jgi:hypothetical protein
MHPDLMRELIDQRGREMRSQAGQARLARTLRTALRGRRHAAGAAPEELAMPPIPDYVDGTFRADREPAPEHGTPAAPYGRAA